MPILTRRSTTRVLPAFAAVLLLELAACSGGDDEGGGDDGVDPATRLAAARAVIDDAESLQFTIGTDDFPSGTTGLVDAEGVGTHAPAFEGSVTASVSGVSTGADVISVDGSTYLKILTPFYTEQDPARYGAPDPADLMSTETGVSSLLTSTEDLVTGDQVRDGEDVLTRIEGTLAGTTVARVIPTASDTGVFEVSYDLDDDDVLRTATLSGPFYPDTDDVTYTLTIDASDEPVDIEAP